MVEGKARGFARVFTQQQRRRETQGIGGLGRCPRQIDLQKVTGQAAAGEQVIWSLPPSLALSLSLYLFLSFSAVLEGGAGKGAHWTGRTGSGREHRTSWPREVL